MRQPGATRVLAGQELGEQYMLGMQNAPRFSGVEMSSPFLKTKRRYEVGLDALRAFGVLK